MRNYAKKYVTYDFLYIFFLTYWIHKKFNSLACDGYWIIFLFWNN